MVGDNEINLKNVQDYTLDVENFHSCRGLFCLVEDLIEEVGTARNICGIRCVFYPKQESIPV